MQEALVCFILWGVDAPQSTFTRRDRLHAGAPRRCYVQLQQVPGTLSPMQKADAPHVYTPQYRLLLVQSLKTGFPRLTNCIFTSKTFFFLPPSRSFLSASLPHENLPWGTFFWHLGSMAQIVVAQDTFYIWHAGAPQQHFGSFGARRGS